MPPRKATNGPMSGERTELKNLLLESIKDAKETAHRTERAVMGGWDETGTKWVTGLREEVKTMAIEQVLIRQEMTGLKDMGKWAIGGIWAIVLGVVIALSNSYFQWWGYSHTQVQTTQQIPLRP